MIVPAYKTLIFTFPYEKKNSPDFQLDRAGRVLARKEPSICPDVRPNITRDVSVEFNILLNCKVGSNLNLTCSEWTISRLLFIGSLFD